MRWRTCDTCWVEGPCEVREALRPKLVGLGLTSVKHRCPKKWDRFPLGSVVVVNFPSYDDEYGYDESIEEKQAVVVGRSRAGGLLVWVYDNEGLKESSSGGAGEVRHLYAARMVWCRVTEEWRELCKHCGMPSDAHPDGLGDCWCPTREPPADSGW